MPLLAKRGDHEQHWVRRRGVDNRAADDLQHVLGVDGGVERFDRVQAAHGCSVHVAGEERDADPAGQANLLELLDEPVALLLVVARLCGAEGSGSQT